LDSGNGVDLVPRPAGRPARQGLAIHGCHDDEARDAIVTIPVLESLQDPMVLYDALTEHPNFREWGYRVAVGPAELGQAVIFRDPEWGDEEPPEGPAESFHELMIWDLESKRVVQRIEYSGELGDGTTLGADAERVVIEVGGM
jgi:hypothetical protein